MVPATNRMRCLEKLYVHEETLHCALRQRCCPCCYKIVIYSRADALPNQRPEQCIRHSSSHDLGEKKANGCIGLYNVSDSLRILTVGDGDLSFSHALFRSIRGLKCSQLVATLHTSRDLMIATYPTAAESILVDMENDQYSKYVHVEYEVDATQSSNLTALCAYPKGSASPAKFDRVIWNFPCIGIDDGRDGQNEQLEANKMLIRNFFAAAKDAVAIDGQVHITHKTKPPYSQWGLVELALVEGWDFCNSVVFDRCLYPGYTNRKVLCDGSFPIQDAQTFIFKIAGKTQEQDNVLAGLSCIPVTIEVLERIYETLVCAKTILPKPAIGNSGKCVPRRKKPASRKRKQSRKSMKAGH